MAGTMNVSGAVDKLVGARTPASPYGGMVYNSDPNANLREAVFAGNEQNANAINQYGQMANLLTMNMNNQMSNAYGGYNERARELLGAMGTADPMTLARYKGIAYGGLDQGYQEATDRLQAQLGQRGLANSGVGGLALRDMAQNRMRAGAEAGTKAYNQAITASDATRGTQLTGEGNLYNANMQNLLGNYGRTLGVQGQNLQNILNQSQQRIANLTGYAQLGRGMSGMANNYLAQAGAGYGNIGGMAGQTALGLGSNAVNYNSGMNYAQSKFNDSGKAGSDIIGATIGTIPYW